jgi:hypothetical protein
MFKAIAKLNEAKTKKDLDSRAAEQFDKSFLTTLGSVRYCLKIERQAERGNRSYKKGKRCSQSKNSRATESN